MRSPNIAMRLVVKFWIVFADFQYSMLHESYRCCCVVCKIDLGDVISIHIQQEYREILMFRYLEVVENHLWRWYPKTYHKRVENDFQSTWDILKHQNVQVFELLSLIWHLWNEFTVWNWISTTLNSCTINWKSANKFLNFTNSYTTMSARKWASSFFAFSPSRWGTTSW